MDSSTSTSRRSKRQQRPNGISQQSRAVGHTDKSAVVVDSDEDSNAELTVIRKKRGPDPQASSSATRARKTKSQIPETTPVPTLAMLASPDESKSQAVVLDDDDGSNIDASAADEEDDLEAAEEEHIVGPDEEVDNTDGTGLGSKARLSSRVSVGREVLGHRGSVQVR